MGLAASKKASKQPNAKKTKLTRDHQLKKNTETKRVKYNTKAPMKNNHIENDKGILPFFQKENHVHVHTSAIPVVTQTENNNSENSVSEPLNNSTQESDDPVMSENNVEPTVPTSI